MRRFLVPVGTLLVLTTAAWGDLAWKQVDFTNLVAGAVSYDAGRDNVVVAGTSFYETIRSGGLLGTQLVGGDGIDVEVEGNFAVYGVFNYSDPDNVLGWATANSSTLLAIELRAWGLEFSPSGATDSFTLDAKDMPGTDYLTATFAELGTWGYTDIADAENVWMDVFVLPTSASAGIAAVSIVIEDFELHGPTFPDFDQMLVAGPLQGYTPGVTPGSGIRVAPVPLPGAALLGVLGLGTACRFLRRMTA